MTDDPSDDQYRKPVSLIPRDVRAAVFERFCFSYDPEDSKLAEEIGELPLALRAVGETFQANLRSASSTIPMPFISARTAVLDQRHNALRISERILLAGSEYGEDGTSEAELNTIANKLATQRLREEIATNEGQDQIAAQTIYFLYNLQSDSDFSVAAAELLKQGIVLIWSTLEVMSMDLLRHLLNLKPELAAVLVTDMQTKKHFPDRAIRIDIAERWHFDVANHMGDILLAERRLGGLETIRDIYGRLFGDDPKLMSVLSSPNLWRLAQKRHLIVHRRGVVDGDYLQKTGEPIEVGNQVKLTGEQLEEYLGLVRSTGTTLIHAVAKAV